MNKTFNLLVTVMYKGGTILHDVLDEQLVTNKISTMLINEGYKFSIADDALIDERLKYEKVKKSDWIPVSERLPSEDGYYLVSCKGGNIHTDFFWCDNGNGSKHNNTWLNTHQYEIIAWQPLPEPYKE
jgi:hypothetical protein